MMKIPTIKGIIRRRLLLNYRVAPEVIAGVLPGNFQPKLHHGYAVAGICLIRLEQVRPKGLPSVVGITSENSAHRIAVEWEQDGEMREGVFVPRRDTDSRMNALAGGKIFPGVHHLSRFLVDDDGGKISMRVEEKAHDDKAEPSEALVDVLAEETGVFPSDSIFSSLAESSRFFENGCVGYSARPDSCTLDGLTLSVPEWNVSPLNVTRVSSSYFDDQSLFPESEIAFDHALLMRDIAHEWHSEPEMQAV